jgi:hypothetical protein
VHVLRQGIALLTRLDDATYRRAIGPQLRHTLDFYASFLRGLDGGRIDYDTRERDPLVESSRRIARERFAEVIAALERIGPERTAQPVEVRTEADTLAPDEPEWCPSSVRRELQFLLSHTVHHNALVKELLHARGVAVGDAFGVAPSTLEHRARIACAR